MALTTNIAILLVLCAFVQGYTDCGRLMTIVLNWMELTECMLDLLGSEVGTLSSLEIPGCNEDERCILKRGTNATVEIDFAISEY